MFKDIKDPDTGKKIIKDIYCWEEIYGKSAVNAPLDVILDLERGYGVQELLKSPDELRHASRSKKETLSILAPPSTYDWLGDHSPNGILFMYGGNIKSNCKIDASVIDIVPTVLAAMNIPIPSNIDGRALEEAFIKKPKIKKVDVNEKKKKLLTEAEIKKIKKLKLKI